MDGHQDCVFVQEKTNTARRFTSDVAERIQKQEIPRMNAIWLELTGCSGNIISFFNSNNPDLNEVLTQIVNITYENTLMAAEGENAFDKFLETLDTDFILLVEGAVSTMENGKYNIVANYKGERITAYEAVRMAGDKAKYVVAVGTCATYGGISAAAPNPSGCKSIQGVMEREVIKLPGCPSHPDWVVGTIAHLVGYGKPALDSEGRPLLFYSTTIHDNCTRRGFFDQGMFANKFGEETCMFKLGCRGPITKTDCPRRKWNSYVNWPVGDNTNCIGCAQQYFPDGMEPFIRY